jgi:hypothetical protein
MGGRRLSLGASDHTIEIPESRRWHDICKLDSLMSISAEI